MTKPIHPKTITGQALMFLAHQNGTWATWGSDDSGSKQHFSSSN